MKNTSQDNNTRTNGLQSELTTLRRELISAKKVAKAAEQEHQTREIRLARALEECEKFKGVLARATDQTKDEGVKARRENDSLRKQVRTLERQRAELLTAFKKQVKMIECLKKQKCHIEAAKLLSFTEEEFVKVLDWE